jgi:Peptidase family M48
MVTITASVSPSVAARRVAHFGVWRAVIAMPAMLGSLLLLLVVFGWAGRWEPVVMLTWLTCGAAVCTPIGECIAVRVGGRFGRPRHQQRRLLEPVWRAALVRCGMSGEDLDLYVRRGREPNAYAVGRRGVAVTSGAVEEFRACRMGHEYLEAILCHELGHHRTGSSQYVLTARWLGAPWALGRTPAHRHRIGHHRPAAAEATARCGAGRRRAGRGRSGSAAGRYRDGAHVEFGGAVRDRVAIGPGPSSRKVNWARRLLSRHPSLDRRLEELDATVIRPPLGVGHGGTPLPW